MQEWLKTVGAIVAAIGLVGGLVLWSHSELRSDIRSLGTDLGGDVSDLRDDLTGVREEIAGVRERLARIEGHLGIPAQSAQ